MSAIPEGFSGVVSAALTRAPARAVKKSICKVCTPGIGAMGNKSTETITPLPCGGFHEPAASRFLSGPGGFPDRKASGSSQSGAVVSIHPSLSATTWLQPPGAAPRSTTARTSFLDRKEPQAASSSRSLKAERERYACGDALRCLTYGSRACRESHERDAERSFLCRIGDGRKGMVRGRCLGQKVLPNNTTKSGLSCHAENAAYSAMPATTLVPGYKHVESFGPDEDYLDEEEEVSYVTLDLGVVEPTLLPSTSTYRLIVSLGIIAHSGNDNA